MQPIINPSQSSPSAKVPSSKRKAQPVTDQTLPVRADRLKFRLVLSTTLLLLLLQLVGIGYSTVLRFAQQDRLFQIGELLLACLVLIGLIILVSPLLKQTPVQRTGFYQTTPTAVTESEGFRERVAEIEAMLKELHSVITLMNENIVTVYQEADLDTNDLKRAIAAVATIIELDFNLKRNLELVTASTSDALTFELNHQIETIDEIDLKLGQTSVVLQTISGRVDELSALMQQLAASGQDLNSQMALIKEKLNRTQESIPSNLT